MGLKYYRTGDKVKITVEDFSGAKIETLHCNISDRKKYAQILQYLKDKYGCEPEITAAPKDLKAEEVNWWE